MVSLGTPNWSQIFATDHAVWPVSASHTFPILSMLHLLSDPAMVELCSPKKDTEVKMSGKCGLDRIEYSSPGDPGNEPGWWRWKGQVWKTNMGGESERQEGKVGQGEKMGGSETRDSRAPGFCPVPATPLSCSSLWGSLWCPNFLIKCVF